MGRPVTPATIRLVGVTTALAALASLALAVVSTASEAQPTLYGLEQRLIVAANLLLVPLALYLVAWLSPLGRALAVAAGTCGVLSLLLWAAAPLLELWRLEAVWIALAAAWWLGTAPLLMKLRRRLGMMTAIAGVAAVLDLPGTAIDSFPYWALLGAWKLPLSLLWTIWLAVDLLRTRGAG